uniref:Ig-like domain-containing protein n=1 Tax=Oncorhynchus tshawytscha TaxID=74940 RepID=A0A8C8D317_ONCTS
LTLTWKIGRVPVLYHVPAVAQSPAIRLISPNVGDTVTLHCFYEGDMAVTFSWYKQPFGNIPRVMSTFFYKYDSGATFYHEFKGNPRFSVESDEGKNHLRISDMELSDSALYYCGSAYGNKVEFGEGTLLIVKGSESNSKTVIHQSVSKSVQPGDSVSLNCTIHTETCAGEHSVYWFRHGSGESRPGIIYSIGDRSDQCEKNSEAESSTQSCVYNLPKRNLSLSDAGTYYCAVASCGEIVFGNGTKLDIDLTFVFLFHSEIFVFCIIPISLSFSLIFIQISVFLYHSDIVFLCVDTLHYAALNVAHKKPKSGRQRSAMETDTVYSGVTPKHGLNREHFLFNNLN